MAYDGTVKIGTELNTDGLQKGMSGLGGFAQKGFGVLASVAKTAAAAVTGVSAALGATVKAALDVTASMEQNIGGVETLFKESAAAVIEAANNAYKTAGMSANDYMSTVTSFSAALLQGLSGDTKKAAQVADMALTDMSDNANKMGTGMESIQNAYQGFAKQNYTMLDNLKLGYGGTKTEMQRLLADAQELSGVKYDINNLSDVYSAIHVIQEEMGITGTTAKEAATTIEGSMTSAKAAWNNFLAGVTSPEDLVASFATAASVILSNLGEIIPRLAQTIPAAKDLIIEGILSNSEQLLESGRQILSSLMNGVTEKLVEVYPLAANIATSFLSGVQEYLPVSLQEGRNLLMQLGAGLQQAIPEFLASALPVLMNFTSFLNEEAGRLIDSGIQFIYSIVDGLVAALPDLIAYVPTIIKNVADIINENVPKLLVCGANIIIKLINGIVDNIPNLIAEFPKIISSIFSVIGAVNWIGLGSSIIKGIWSGIKSLAQSIPQALKSIGDTTVSALKNIKWLELGKSVINFILNGIKSLVTAIPNALANIGKNALAALGDIKWGDLGKNIISGIATGVTNTASSLVQSVKDTAANAFNAVKNFFGIHSPSRKMKDEIGIPMIQGASEGVREETPEFAQTAVQSAQDVMKELNASDYVRQFQAAQSRHHADGIENTVAAAADTQENTGIAPTQAGTDYEKLSKANAKSFSEALDGMRVEMDGKDVGQIVTPYANDNMNDISDLEERGVI